MIFCICTPASFPPPPANHQVLETVPAIKKYSGSGPDAFPHKPGAARELTNPALEFIKSLCHVLSLDSTVVDEVGALRCGPITTKKRMLRSTWYIYI